MKLLPKNVRDRIVRFMSDAVEQKQRAPNYASFEWLSGFMAEMRLRASLLKEKVVDNKRRDARLGRRRKPFGRVSGVTSPAGKPLLWRP